MRCRPDTSSPVGALAILVLAACGGDDAPLGTIPRIPESPLLPPIPAEYLSPIPAPFRITFERLSYVTELGVQVDIPYAEGEYRFAAFEPQHADTPVVHVRSLRVVRPRIIGPPDTIVTGFDPFIPLLGPRAVVDRLVVEDGVIAVRPTPEQYAGAWLWRMEDVDFVVEDLRLGGETLPEGFRLVEASAAGVARGRPLRFRRLSGAAERTDGLFEFTADVDLGRTRLLADGFVRRAGGWQVDLAADTLAFAEVRAILRPLPEVGTAELTLEIQGENGRTTYSFERFRAALGESRVGLRGSFIAARESALDDIVLEVAPLRAEDLEAVLGIGLPGGGSWTGRLAADGRFGSGVELSGAFDQRSESGELSHLAVGGRVRLQPDVRVAVNVTGTPVRLADTAFVASISASGRLDSLRVRGTAALAEGAPAAKVARGRTPPGERTIPDGRLPPDGRIAADRRGPAVVRPDPSARLPGGARARLAEGAQAAPPSDDPPRRNLPRLVANLDALVLDRPGGPPRMTGQAFIRSVPGPSYAARGEETAAVQATATGSAVLASDGALAIRIRSESLPLALAPFPAEVEDVQGEIGGEAFIGGTVAAPTFRGGFRLRDGGFRVPSLRLTVEDVGGPIRLEDGALVLDRLTGRANGGTFDLGGRIRFAGGEDYVDLALSAEGVRVSEGDDLGADDGLEAADPRDDLTTVASAELQLRGPLDRPRLNGRAVLRSLPGPPDPATGRPVLPEVLATARGSAVLARGGPIEVRIESERLPLAAFPWPDDVRDVRGSVRGALILGGTIDSPTYSGSGRVREGGFRLPSLGLVVEDFGGPIRFEDGEIVLDRLAGRLGGGPVRLGGRIYVLEGPARVDLGLTLDRGRVVDLDSVQVVASANLRIEGPVDRPRVTGRAALVEGWIYEDVFRPSGALDLESPPYAELAREAPWPENSRLLSAAGEAGDDRLPVVGEVAVDVGPGFLVIDEDSELFGAGRVRVRAGDDGLTTIGIVRVLGGSYNLFGERFRVYGGAFRFDGESLDPQVAVLGEHELDGSLWGRWGNGTIAERMPPLQLFAHGRASTVSETVRRPALLPEKQTDLAALLMYGLQPQPYTGRRYPLFWRPNSGGEVFGERAEAQGIPLLWNYIADEAYDYLPLARGFLEGGHIAVGSRYPARIVVGPLLSATAVLNEDLEVVAAQPLDGGSAPGLRVRLRTGRIALELFNEPRFFARAAAGAGHPGFHLRRSTGVTVRWQWDF